MYCNAVVDKEQYDELMNKYLELQKQYKEENRLLTQRIKERAMSCDSGSSTFSQTVEETFK